MNNQTKQQSVQSADICEELQKRVKALAAMLDANTKKYMDAAMQRCEQAIKDAEKYRDNPSLYGRLIKSIESQLQTEIVFYENIAKSTDAANQAAINNFRAKVK